MSLTTHYPHASIRSFGASSVQTIPTGTPVTTNNGSLFVAGDLIVKGKLEVQGVIIEGSTSRGDLAKLFVAHFLPKMTQSEKRELARELNADLAVQDIFGEAA